MTIHPDKRYRHRVTTFSVRLRKVRTEKGFSQEKLAEETGLSTRMIQKLERVSPAVNPRLTTLLALAEALEVDPSDLLASDR